MKNPSEESWDMLNEWARNEAVFLARKQELEAETSQEEAADGDDQEVNNA